MPRNKAYNLILVAGIAMILFPLIHYGGLHAKEWYIQRNDRLAQLRFDILYAGLEEYLADNRGEFPNTKKDLERHIKPGTKFPFCNERMDGYVYECMFGLSQFGLKAYPVKYGLTGEWTSTRSIKNSVFVNTLNKEDNIIKSTPKGYLRYD